MNSLQACVKNLFERRDPRVRLRTTLKLRRHRSRAVLPAVIEQLESEVDPAVTAALILVLAEHGGVEQVPLVSTYLSHRDHRVVQAAVLALYRVGGEDAIPLLVTLLAREDRRVLRQALAALARTDPALLGARLALLVRAPRESARSAGAACLALLAEAETRALAGDVDAVLAAMREEPPAPAHRVPESATRRVPNRFHEGGWRVVAALAICVALLTAHRPADAARVALDVPVRERVVVAPAPLPPLPSLPSAPADASLLLRRAEVLRAASLAHRPVRPVATPAERRRWALELLAQGGVKDPKYLDLRAREAASDPERQRLFLQVRARVAAGDVARALALVRDAIAAADAADLALLVALRAKERELALLAKDFEAARAARLAELTAQAAIQRILEGARDRDGKPLAPAGAARAVLEARDRLAAMPPEELHKICAR